MVAMDNATKNVGRVMDKHRMQYNRVGQSIIITEMIEIISGAAALKD